jgi:hypothetical protein
MNRVQIAEVRLARAGGHRFHVEAAGAGPRTHRPGVPTMTAVARRFAFALASLVLAGCTLDKPAWLEQKQANDAKANGATANAAPANGAAANGATASAAKPSEADANYYAEEVWENRLYVFGTSANHKLFQSTHDLQFAKTFIGAGPNGQTVRLELDPKNPAVYDRVHAEYKSRHGTDLED